MVAEDADRCDGRPAFLVHSGRDTYPLALRADAGDLA